MKKIALLLLFFFGLNSYSQQAKTVISDPTKYLNLITESDLKILLTTVASDEMEGRDTGSPGQKKAGKFLIQQYQIIFIFKIRIQNIKL